MVMGVLVLVALTHHNRVAQAILRLHPQAKEITVAMGLQEPLAVVVAQAQ
jgi:hypothetical protein